MVTATRTPARTAAPESYSRQRLHEKDTVAMIKDPSRIGVIRRIIDASDGERKKLALVQWKNETSWSAMEPRFLVRAPSGRR